MTISESCEALQDILSDMDSETKIRWELLKKIHNPPEIVVTFDEAATAMEERECGV